MRSLRASFSQNIRFGGARRLLGKASGLLVGRIVGAVGNGVSLVLLARWSGADEFGRFAVSWAVLQAVAGVMSFGVPVFVLRSAVRNRTDAALFGIAINYVLSALSVVVGLGFSFMLGGHSALLLGILAASLAWEQCAEVRIGLGTQYGQGKMVNWVLGMRGALICAMVIGAKALHLPLVASFAGGRFVVMLLAFAVLWFATSSWSGRLKVPPRDDINLLIQIGAQKGVSSFRVLDVTIAGLFGGVAVAGLYGAVQKLVVPVTILADSLRVVAMAKIVNASSDRVRSYSRLFTLGAVALAGLMVGVGALSDFLIPIALGTEFLPGRWAFRFVLLAAPALGAAHLLLTILQDRGRAGFATFSTGVSIAVQLILVGVGSHFYGADGAGAAFAFAVWGWLVWLNFAVVRRRSSGAAGIRGVGSGL